MSCSADFNAELVAELNDTLLFGLTVSWWFPPLHLEVVSKHRIPSRAKLQSASVSPQVMLLLLDRGNTA